MGKRISYVFAVFFTMFLCLSFSLNAQDNRAFKKEYFIKNTDTLNYRILLPKGFSKENKYPVVLFLHGAGERGNDNESQLTHGSDLFLRHQEDFPSIVIFPQAPRKDYWAKVNVNRDTTPFRFDFMNSKPSTASLQLVMDLMDEISSKKYTDNNRIYVGGLSMGGMGTFELIYKKPDMFAAAFAICGGANPEIAKAYPHGFNIWLFHGKADDVVLPQYSEAMALAINHYGGNAKLSLYPNVNHNSWDSAFAEPNLLPWLFSNSK